MASRGNKLKIPSYIINIIQDKLGEIEAQRIMQDELYSRSDYGPDISFETKLDPKIIKGDNGANHCWLNTAMYVFIAYWDIFQTFNDNTFLTSEKVNCNTTTLGNFHRSKNIQFVRQITKLFNDIHKGFKIMKNDTYVEMIGYIKNYFLSTRETDVGHSKEDQYAERMRRANSSLNELPNHGSFGDPAWLLNLFTQIIFKNCPYEHIFEFTLKPCGENEPLKQSDFRKKFNGFTDDGTKVRGLSGIPKNYEMCAILVPVATNEKIVDLERVNERTRNVSHWTCYVRKKNNKWMFFDMLSRDNGSNERQEYNFSDIIRHLNRATGNQRYNTYVCKLNTNYIYGEGILPDINSVCY